MSEQQRTRVACMREGESKYLLAIKPPITEEDSVYLRVRFLADSVRILSDGSQLFEYTPEEFSEKGVGGPASKRGFMKMVRESMQQLHEEGEEVRLDPFMAPVGELHHPNPQPVEA